MNKNINILSIAGIVLGAGAIALGLNDKTIIIGIVLSIIGAIISLIARKKAKTAGVSTLLATIGFVVSLAAFATCVVLLAIELIHESEKDAMFPGAIDAIYYGDK